MQMSSTIFAVCGRMSLTHAPPWPYCLNLWGEPSIFGTPLMKAKRRPLFVCLYVALVLALTPLALRTKCRRLHMEFGLDLVILDYIQLMGGDTRTENRVQEVSYISRNLKVLARELNVPVLAAAQLSRAVEQRTDKRPVLSDLRESGSIEQDADIVMFIYRPDQYEKDTVKQNVAEIIIAKHRNGPTGSVELVFINHLAKFVDAATRNIDLSQA